MIDEIVTIGDAVLKENAEQDVMFAKILKSQVDFRKKVEPYAELVRLPYPYAR
jgi:TRAP-type mannitol/chloroaromatic compound transport system substrate-binding protein